MLPIIWILWTESELKPPICKVRVVYTHAVTVSSERFLQLLGFYEQKFIVT